jgi:integral membrane sensor domain MASE1
MASEGKSRLQRFTPLLLPRSHWRYWLMLAVIAALYFATGKLGLALSVEAKQVTAVWPPSGISLAALLLFGYRAWPAIALGAFLLNFLAHRLWHCSGKHPRSLKRRFPAPPGGELRKWPGEAF